MTATASAVVVAVAGGDAVDTLNLRRLTFVAVERTRTEICARVRAELAYCYGAHESSNRGGNVKTI